MRILLFITLLINFAAADVFDDLRRIPVQDQGRIKPLGTYADFTLLQFNGKRSFDRETGNKLNSIEWLKYVLFSPEKSDTFKHFVTDNATALELVDFPSDRISKKRMRFSFEDLKDFREKLYSKSAKIVQTEAGERSIDEQAILHLALKLKHYERLRNTLEFARIGAHMPVEVSSSLDEKSMTEFFKNLSSVRTGLRNAASKPGFNPAGVEDFFGKLKGLGESEMASRLFLIPASENRQKEWFSIDDILVNRLVDFKDELNYEREYTLLALWEKAWQERNSPEFAQAVKKLSESSANAAIDRSEYSKVPLEISFYKVDWFTKSLIFFVLSFLLICFSWLKGKSRIALYLCRVSFASAALASCLLTAGIVIRCLIRSRPPVSTLYETVLFITAAAVITAGFIAVVRHSSLMVGVMALAGCLGMFLSIKYEMKEAVDTMPQLQAVLDTNFWLSTHVTSVTLGYAAGILAGIISHFYLILKFMDLKGWRELDPVQEKELNRYVYGILCFGLIFSFIGTLLGGIWANYSWGRFWGWDPKENGAMLIVLWFIIILHARKGGYIRSAGLHIMAVLSVIVISFSWWGVNLLGVGLHSYGFTSGVSKILMAVYLTEAAVALAGIFICKANKKNKGITNPA